VLLRGRVAIVCGASGGIGTATVRAFAAGGASVVLAALDDPTLGALAREAERNGARALAVPTDVTRRVDIDRLVAKTLVTFRRIDILVNVAGIGSSPSLCDSTDDELERVLAVNLLGPARLIHAVLPIMKAQRRGSIVNIGSIAGEAGVMGIYSASKFGVRGLSDSVRREVRSFNIDVTLIEPGFVRTPMNAAMGTRLPGPEIVADAILDAIIRPRRVRIVPGNYRLPVLAVKAFPGLTDLVFGNARVQRRLNRDARASRHGAATLTAPPHDRTDAAD
jgi:NAD(P)-dependent dehydrogenase (short-subunit alcohol dehydrogenase family)